MSANASIARTIGPALRNQIRRTTDRVALIGGFIATAAQVPALANDKATSLAPAIATLVIALCGLVGLRTRAPWTPYAYVAILWAANCIALVSFGPLLGLGTIYILSIALAFMFLSRTLRWLVVLGMSTTPVVIGALFERGWFDGSPSFALHDGQEWIRILAVAAASMIAIAMILDYSMRHLSLARAELARALHNERESRRDRESVERELARVQRSDLIAELAAEVGTSIGAALAVISARAESLTGELDDEARACLVDVIASASAAQSTMRSLTLFAPDTRVGDARCDAGLAATTVPQMVRHTIPKRIHLDVMVERDAWVPLTSSDMSRILTNLVLNARDAISESGTIALTVKRASGTVTIEVADDGAGMEAETLTRLFQPFFTTKPIGRGTGLGLATAKILIERAGGEIVCSTVLRKGTRFTIRLPDARAGAQLDSGATAASAMEHAHPVAR